MPRHIDPEVEGRILEAARKLWRKGGEKALSMRAVAKLAGTNTPAVYRRFRTREDILKALVQAYQRDLFEIIQTCASLQEVALRYVDYALSRPREYQLVMSGLLPRMTKERPSLDLAVRQSSKWLGDPSADYRSLVLVLAAMLDGATMMRVTGFLSDENFAVLRPALSKAVDVLAANAANFRG
jgi:AcrR family transcriptional regulator